jgi:uncharacterized repeat protein (TIGR02543 family)
LALAALCAAAAWGADALVPEKNIALALKASVSPAETLVQGDVLQVAVATQTDFPIYANYTIFYYDTRYFAPAESTGVVCEDVILGGTELPGRKITDFLTPDADNPLWQVGSPVGSLHAASPLDYPAAWKNAEGSLAAAYENYAAIALKIPYDTVGAPSPATRTGSTPFFSCYFKVKEDAPVATNDTTADIFFAQAAVRTPKTPNAAMYYSAGPTSDGYRAVAVALPAPLQYSVEALAQDPVCVNVVPGEHGRLAGNLHAVRNIEKGTTLEAQIAKKFPVPMPDEGYAFVGWALQEDYVNQGSLVCDLLPGETPLATVNGTYVPDQTLVAVFRPLVTLRFALEDGTLFAEDVQIYGTPLDDAYFAALHGANPPRKTGYQFVGWQDCPTAFDIDRTLFPGFVPRTVRVVLCIEDLREPADARQIQVLNLNLLVGEDFCDAVPNDEFLLDYVAPLDPVEGYALERFAPSQANGFYTVPVTDEDEIFVTCARVHRGTYFVRYNPNAPDPADVTNLPDTQEKQRGTELTLDTRKPVRRGYTFVGWAESESEDPGGVPAYPSGGTYALDADLVLFAMWSKNPAPAIVGGNVNLQFKSSQTLRLETSAPGTVRWSSSNSGVVSVDPASGKITGAKKGVAIITATDGDDFTSSVTVTVDYVWWQWLLIIFLFGWIWYI